MPHTLFTQQPYINTPQQIVTQKKTKKTMQVIVTCPDWGLPAVAVTAGADSVVSDVLTAAAGEWDVDPEEVELSFAGDTLCETERLADHGVVVNSELVMARKQFRIFDKDWFDDEVKQEKLLHWIKDHITENLCLDTPTFTEDGCLTVDGILAFEGGYIPIVVKRISFRNSNSEVRTIGDSFLARYSSLTTLDLAGLNNVTKIGCSFLQGCFALTSLDVSGLNSVTKIGHRFLGGCLAIASLDLTVFNSVIAIGENFLTGCEGLQSVQVPENNSSLFMERSKVLEQLLPNLNPTKECNKRSKG